MPSQAERDQWVLDYMYVCAKVARSYSRRDSVDRYADYLGDAYLGLVEMADRLAKRGELDQAGGGYAYLSAKRKVSERVNKQLTGWVHGLQKGREPITECAFNASSHMPLSTQLVDSDPMAVRNLHAVLPAEMLEVLIRWGVEDYLYKDICAESEQTYNKLLARIHKAQRWARKLLGDYYDSK